MARPHAIQKLEHGKLLSQGNFPQFVDTWNYTVDRVENMKGDADVRPDTGRIKLDNSDPEHPVIRYVGQDNGSSLAVDNISLSSDGSVASIKGWQEDEAETPESLSAYEFVTRDLSGDLKYLSLSSVGGGGGVHWPAPFEPSITKSESQATIVMTNCCLRLARSYYFFDDQQVTVNLSADRMVYVGIEQKSPPTIQCFTRSFSGAADYLSSSQTNCISATVTPLFRVLSGDIACDYRCLMNIQAYDHAGTTRERPW